MDPSVQIALIVGIFGFSGPLLLAVVQYMVHSREKRQDYARQDVVAKQAATVAKSLLISNEQVARNAETAATAVLVVTNKLDVIHTLVNSNLTTALQNELEAASRELVLMREVITLHTAAGRKPSVETLAAIRAAESKVSELRATLNDRLK